MDKNNKPRKLSPTQRKILELGIDEDYQLGQYTGFNARVAFQKGGLGRSGAMHSVSWSTFFFLAKVKFIEQDKTDSIRVIPFSFTQAAKDWWAENK